MRLRKGDQVKILSGKDRGKTGSVLKVSSRDNCATVSGLNLYKKKVRPKRTGQKGEIVLIPRPIHISNIALVCQGCKKQTRVGYRLEGEKKIRYCIKCKAAI